MQRGPQNSRIVGPVIHDKRNTRGLANPGNLLNQSKRLPRPNGFMPDLQDPSPALNQRLGRSNAIKTKALKRSSIENWINGGKSELRQGLM